tara:strand:- start:2468 stop:2662 length:195 start_codon:yes stop_codon:yes gene_type:complete
MKLIKNKSIISSNQNALYIRILAASVPCILSINVPTPIAAENVKNKIAVSLVETIKDAIFLTIC